MAARSTDRQCHSARLGAAIEPLAAIDNEWQDAVGGAYERLAEVKRRHDPTNLFRLNQNIPPIGRGALIPTRVHARPRSDF